MNGQSLKSSDNYNFNYEISQNTINNSDPFIEKISSGTIKCHARVIEVEHQDLFYSKWHKIVNSVFKGEPYQFGHQTSEYLIRVEDMCGSYSMQCADFFLYGNYLGRLMPGDEVEVIAKDKGTKRVAKSIFNVSTQSKIHPGAQMSAGLIRNILVIIAIVMYLLLAGICSYFTSEEGFNKLVTVVGIVGGGLLTKNWIKKKLMGRK